MKSKIVILLTVLLASGCAYLAPAKAAIRGYEKMAANELVDSSHHILCNAPFSTLVSKYSGSELVSLIAVCGFEIEGYKIVPDS